MWSWEFTGDIIRITIVETIKRIFMDGAIGDINRRNKCIE